MNGLCLFCYCHHAAVKNTLQWEVCCSCCSVAKSCPPSLELHGLQHTRIPCPSLSPRVCSNYCSLDQWCYLIISSSATPFSFWLQSCPASESFPVSRLFALGGQCIGTSASATVLPINIQHWFLLRLIGLISLLSKGLSRVFSRTIWKHHWWIKYKIQIKAEMFLLLYSDPIHSFYFPPQVSSLPFE